MEKSKKFKLCGTGIGFGLLAIVVTIPVWGIFGPVFISRFSPIFSDIISVVIPVAAFSIVLWKTCTTYSSDSKGNKSS